MAAWGTAHGILGNDWRRLDGRKVTVEVRGGVEVKVAGNVVIGEVPGKRGGVGLRIEADQLVAVTGGGVEREK